jgi:hypothetical protein
LLQLYVPDFMSIVSHVAPCRQNTLQLLPHEPPQLELFEQVSVQPSPQVSTQLPPLLHVQLVSVHVPQPAPVQEPVFVLIDSTGLVVCVRGPSVPVTVSV